MGLNTKNSLIDNKFNFNNGIIEMKNNNTENKELIEVKDNKTPNKKLGNLLDITV